jgi:nitrile hydratase
VAPSPGERPFDEPWEGRVHGMMLALGVGGNLHGSFRYAIERMDPAHYLESSYYEHWLAAVETLLLEAGTLAPGELEVRERELAEGGEVQVRRDPDAAAAVRSVLRPFPVTDAEGPEPRFALGDRVRVQRFHTGGHTRCPGYVRGATGVVDRVHAAQPLPDVMASAGEMRPERYYTVAFEAAELWGSGAEAGNVVRVDLWESYLEGTR